MTKDQLYIGDVFGVNLIPLDTKDEDGLNKYIEIIKDIMHEEYTSLYIEESLSPELRENILDNLSIKGNRGKAIRIYNIPFIIGDIILEFGSKPMEEVLIISNNVDEIINIIYSVADMFRFVSVMGLNSTEGETVYEEILDNIGISVYLVPREEVSFRRYGIIINTLEEDLTHSKDIGKNIIIMDFSEKKPFKGINKYVIEDLSVDISHLELVDNPWIDKEIDSNLYDCLFQKGYNKFCRIIKDDTPFTINEFINQGLKIKGGY